MLKVNRRASPVLKDESARLMQAEWDRKWNNSLVTRWAGRPPPAEVINAVASGWLPESGRMVDLGCGTAEIAAWFAERGYEATGIDIAQPAVERAAARHQDLSAPLELIAMDLCTQTLPDRAFDILVDRGCLHQIPKNLVADYVRNVSAMAATGARMLLFMKAFRVRSWGDAEETAARTNWTRRAFAGQFKVERALPTYLKPNDPENPLPGMAFWLSRTP